MNTDADVLSGLADRVRSMAEGFVAELAVAWPLLNGVPGEPVIASVGSQRQVVVDPERVFRYALRVRAQEIVLAHNHLVTAGPSEADRAVTRRLVAAGRVLGVPLVAHLVVEPDAVYELVADQLLPMAPPPSPRTHSPACWTGVPARVTTCGRGAGSRTGRAFDDE